MRPAHLRVVVDAHTNPARLPAPYGGVAVARVLAPEATLGEFDRQDRRRVAVVVTTDGRRVHMPLADGLADVSLLSLLRSLLSLDGLLALITGSRRENRGTRGDVR